MTKMKISIAAAILIATIALLLLAQRQAQSNLAQDRLRQENHSLREQISQAQELSRPQPQPEVDTNELDQLRQSERELLRLRGEVSRLRQEVQTAPTESPQETVLKGSARLNTVKKYQPPVEITIVAKTDTTNLRLAYAADQVIFNWELDTWQLRVDGGPASGRHKPGAGHIPLGQFVTIRWVVTPTHQAIYADGELRFEHQGDYSRIDRCVTVFPAEGSTVTVKSIQVKPLTNAAR